jgi:hypothetical protein
MLDGVNSVFLFENKKKACLFESCYFQLISETKST